MPEREIVVHLGECRTADVPLTVPDRIDRLQPESYQLWQDHVVALAHSKANALELWVVHPTDDPEYELDIEEPPYPEPDADPARGARPVWKVTVDELEARAGRRLNAVELLEIERAITNSTVNDAVAAAVEQVVPPAEADLTEPEPKPPRLVDVLRMSPQRQRHFNMHSRHFPMDDCAIEECRRAMRIEEAGRT